MKHDYELIGIVAQAACEYQRPNKRALKMDEKWMWKSHQPTKQLGRSKNQLRNAE